MLARSFMTPEALGLTPERHAALVEVLRMLEAGEIKERQRKGNYGEIDKPPKYFSMEVYHCGTTACLAGWAAHVSGDDWFHPEVGYGGVDEGGWPSELNALFYWENEDDWQNKYDDWQNKYDAMIGGIFLEDMILADVTMAEATAALRRYLETGKPFP